MTEIYSLSPISSPAAKVLVLGSIPGKRSLEVQQYYAHPQNTFWPIMAALLGFDLQLPYPTRVQHLQESGIALWDVLATCERQSSLDADIVESSIIANDFTAFLGAHSPIQHIFCNGAKAYDSFLRHVRPRLGDKKPEIPLTRLPSTSPAHAAMNFQAKLAAWNVISDFVTSR